MGFLSQLQVLYVDCETTYGTAPATVTTPTVTYALLARVGQLKIDGEYIERNFNSNSLSKYAGKIGKQKVELEVEIEAGVFKSSLGSLTNVAVEGRLLRALGFSETRSAGSAIYQPAADPNTYGASAAASVAYRLYQNGIYWTITGCRASKCVIMLEGGKPVTYKFTLVGKYAVAVDGANVAPTYPTFDTKVLTGSIPSYIDRCADKVEITIENTLYECPDLGAVTNIDAFYIVGRKVSIKTSIEAVTVATQNYFTDYSNAVETDLTFGSIQDVAGNDVMSIVLNNVTLTTAPSPTDRGGILSLPLEGEAHTASGNDEIVITYTA